MVEIVVAIMASFSAIVGALVEKTRRENKRDHEVVADKLDLLGKSLGRSIDRVEENTNRTEQKLDEHIADHARGTFK